MCDKATHRRGLWVVRYEAEHRLEGGLGGCEVALGVHLAAKVAVHIGILWVNPNRMLESIDGPIQVTLGLQRIANCCVSGGILWRRILITSWYAAMTLSI